MASGVVFNHLPQMPDRIQRTASKLVRKAAFDIERVAKGLAPVDTGLLKNSIYTVTGDSSGAGAAATQWLRKKSHSFEQHEQLTFVELGPTDDPLRAMVLVGAKYGIFVEMGTIHMRAQPFLLPAYKVIYPIFMDSWRKFEEMIAA